jgi:hypothetical protein
MSKKAMKLALEALEELNNTNSHWWQEVDRDTVDKIDPAITAIKEALDKQEQGEPVAHCEAGPDFCQQCQLEDSSLALAAAVRYVKNNTPKLVSDEICNALNHIPDATKMVGDLLVEYDMEKTAFAKDLRAVLAPQPKQEQGEPNIQSYPEKDNLHPVAWMDADGNVSDNNDHKCFPIPLYTTTQQRTWVGLTEEEREEIALEVPMDAVCITEAKLKEKNNG